MTAPNHPSPERYPLAMAAGAMAPVGVFDSGVGGLSVLRALRQLLPNEKLLFLADQAHVPYGSRPLAQVQGFAEGIVHYLLAQGAKLVVVACNTASAAALQRMRLDFPGLPFVGMEPAVKPAAETTRSGAVGVLATPATFQGALYASVVERFAQGVRVLQHTCPGLVAQIEAGQLKAPETRRILEDALLPMLAEGIDTVVLGCTHYPFVIPLIEQIAGPGVRVIDPAPAVARQAGRILDALALRNPHASAGSVTYLTSGDPAALQAMLPKLIGESAPVRGVRWDEARGSLEPLAG
ncbi:MAG: glutamate racemase [Anaerolineales bacterium]|nr:glutamate racemase [Anaerolineales bacterium]